MRLPNDLIYQEDDEDPNFEYPIEGLQKRVRHLNNVINHFWRRWSEYLLELRESHRQHASVKNKLSIKRGDIVILEEKNKPCEFWKLTCVEELLAGKDGKVWGAQTRSSTPQGQFNDTQETNAGTVSARSTISRGVICYLWNSR